MIERSAISWRRLLPVLAAMSVALGSSSALAAMPLETSPERDSVVGGQVDRIQLLFAQPIVVDESFVVVTDPSGAAVPSAGPLTTDESGRLLTAPIRRLTEPGTHRVDYRAVTRDGTITISSYEFAFDPGEAPPSLMAEPGASDRAGFWNRWTVLGAVILAAAVIVVWRGRKAWRRW